MRFKSLTSFYRLIALGITAIMAGEMIVLLANERWMHAALVAGLIALIGYTALPQDEGRAIIPIEIQIFLTLFVFATLFLGEVRDFYERIWWWDIVLHGTSGFLLGLLGFLVLYMMNESTVVNLHMRPAFLALFAYFFSIGLGAMWEMFEFAMDQIFGMNMQKPMLGDPSGLTDTMWDLIIDAIGAAFASSVGWLYIRRARDRGSKDWLARFAARYPHMFVP